MSLLLLFQSSDGGIYLSGTSAIDITWATPGDIVVSHAVLLNGTTVIGGGGGSGSAIYYFDGHTSITDTSNGWGSDANAFNDDITLSDYAYNTQRLGYQLVGTGTTAPTSGGTITSVEYSVNYVADIDTDFYGIFSISYSGAALGTLQIDGPVLTFQQDSAYSTLDTPSGGWTWAKVAELAALAYEGEGILG